MTGYGFGLCFIVTVVVKLFWPQLIPYELLELFNFNFSLKGVFELSRYILLYAVVINVIVGIINFFKKGYVLESKITIPKIFTISFTAGVVEEIMFRWIIFFGQIVIYQLLNIVLFGIPQWLYIHITGPLGNLLTLGLLNQTFYGPYWFVGAAMMTSNGKFRDGHLYQGVLGYISAWFTGMFFFYLTINFGLIAAMLIHFLFDVCALSTVYLLDVILKPK